MTDRKSDQDSKVEMAKGMDEAGRGEIGKAGGKADKGGHGHVADPSKLSQGMAESSTGGGGKGSRSGAARGSSS